MTAIAKYSELRLVNTKGMFMQAMEGRYAVPAYNFNNMEQLQAILIGCSESRSPVILQCSGGAIKYMNSRLQFVDTIYFQSNGASAFSLARHYENRSC